MTARCLLILLALLAPTAQAVLPEPGFLLFGNVTGAPPWLPNGTAVGTTLEIRAEGSDTVFATAIVGEDGSYALRVPIDSVDPQAPGTSRPGRPLDLYLAGMHLDSPAALVPLVVPDTGERGSYAQLDIDLDAIVTGAGFSVLDAEVIEGTASGVVNVRIRLEGETEGLPQSVNWLTVGFTATPASGSLCAPGDDFIPASGVANFAPGAIVVTVPLQLCNDALPESTESFLVRLLNPSNGITLVQEEATVTIVDDDGVPTLAVNDINVREPDVGSSTATFRIAISTPQSSPVGFSYATENRTAIAGEDYASASGTVQIFPGESHVDVVVDVLADEVSDGGEQFALVLSNPTGANLADSEGIATIIDAGYQGTVIIDGGDNQTTLDGPIDLAVDPSGSWLFVANRTGESISRFDIDSDDGGLLNEFRWEEFELPGADFGGLVSITASADGNWLIAATSGSAAEGVNALALGADGGLSYSALARNGGLDGQGLAFQGLSGISALAASPDSAHVYVVSRSGNSLSALSLVGSSPLSMIELEQNGVDDPFDTGGLVDGLEAPSDVLVSVDGRSVYAVSPDASAILHFSRDDNPASTLYGHLAFRASYTQASTGSSALSGVSRLASSADGQTLFALSPATGKITSFGVGINGELTRIGSAATDEPGTLATGSALLASADSESVVATSSNPGALHIFKRLSNGNVGAVEVLIAGRDTATGLAGATALAQTEAQPNLVYVAAFDDNRVSLFEIGVGSLVFRDDFED